MAIVLQNVELRKVDLTTRMPFRYGITTLTEVPQLLVFADFVIDGQISRGVAADVLPPKWFTKQPEALVADEIEEMLGVIRTSCDVALKLSSRESIFEWWQTLYQGVTDHPQLQTTPPLLRGFGSSLLERTAIDAFCRQKNLPFHATARSNLLGMQLDELHPCLEALSLADLLPHAPQPRMAIRHTVGLVDPLTDADISDEDRVTDGLPQSLERNLVEYGIKYLKIKVPYDLDEAVARLSQIANLVERTNREIKFTLDGNECFRDAHEFREFWAALCGNKQLAKFIDRRLIALEQPLHRDVALSDDTQREFHSWHDRPRMIIDESDGDLSSLQRALDIGYHGTSYKNCKGVFKGLANGCLLRYLNKTRNTNAYIATGEDLANLGPVALLQDLAVGATLGFEHMERNGHHYFAGLSAFPAEFNDGAIRHHDDLYRKHHTPRGTFATLLIEQGDISLESINKAPFGYALDLDNNLLDGVELQNHFRLD